jgi:chromosome segregation ATPase
MLSFFPHQLFLALDALEYLSLGIVKDVLKMKVMSIEEFDKLNRLNGLLNGGCEDTKKKLEDVTKKKDIFESSMGQFQKGYDHLKFEKDKCNRAVGLLGSERDSLKDTNKELEKKVATLEAERDKLKPANAAASAASAKDADTGGRRLRRRRLARVS